MQHNEVTVEGLLADESFIHYCRNSHEKDVQYWQQYIERNPANRAVIEAAVHEYRLLFTVIAQADLHEQMQQLRNRLELGDEAPVYPMRTTAVTRSLFSLFKYGIVAALILAVAGYWWWQQPAKTNLPVVRDPLQYVSAAGERKTFQFPDGTQVTLNAGSEIVLSSTYNQQTRELFLKGEAFFDVQHNKQSPFIVHTADMDVKALGTAFNVRSYNGEAKTEAVLVRGLVEVTLKKDNNRKVLLHPEEKVLWTAGVTANKIKLAQGKSGMEKLSQGVACPVKKMDDGSIKEVAWTENSLAFNDDPFEEIALQLNRWYNVTIRFEDTAMMKYHFTATFKKEKLEQVLDILRATKPFKYRFDGQQSIVIYQ